MKTERNIFRNLEEFAGKFVGVLSGLMFLLLTGVSLFTTRCFPSDYANEIPYEQMDFFPITLVFALLLGAVVLFLGKQIVKLPEKGERNLKIFLVLVMLWVFILGYLWIRLSLSSPISEQGMVFSSAQRFVQGNYGRLEYGKYLYYYPLQLGLVAYESVVLSVFGLDNYTAIQILNVVGIALSVFFGYRITRYLSEKKEIAAYYLLLAGSCMVYIIYGVYVYGDALAIVCSLFAIWQFLRYLKKKSRSAAILMILSMCAAVLIRSNSLIVFVAMLCVLAVKGISEKKWSYLFCAFFLTIGTLGIRPFLNQYYEAKTDIEVNEGMPSVLWVAMGVQEGDKEAGWFNGYSMYIYQDVCQYHGPTASELGKAEIRARAKEFLKNPGYALDFYWRKFSSQWSEPTYGCFIMTYAAEEERGAIGESLYTGTLNRILQGFMNAYQLLIYASVLLLLIRRRKTKEPLEWYILLIAVIGGVLFHLLWEAKSRYVLPYFVFMLPMAAAGLYEIKEMLQHGRTKDETAETGR